MMHIFCLVAFLAIALFADETPRAFLKVQYEYNNAFKIKNDTDTLWSSYKFLLQIAKDASHFYDPQKFYVDSLREAPSGIYDQLFMEAMSRPGDYRQNEIALGIQAGHTYINIKHFDKSDIEVWDSAVGDKYHYHVEMNDIEWEICDSTKTILGYECQLAEADYHGRRWKVWFTPEIPAQDGPWQLHGLPGLILEASSGPMFSFKATGIQSCDEAFKMPFEQENYFNSKRKSFLKTKKYILDNLGGQISAMTGGAVTVNPNANSVWTELIECDYHE